ncbi:MAG: stage II sporulation protein M [Clostridia bacterium]|nr:stage II sporulation protein M [Clostridia bacterium]
MINRVSKDKTNFKFNLLKELGYIVLLVTFFVGIIMGAFSLKNVDSTSFNEYSESLSEAISKVDTKGFNITSRGTFYHGIKIIAIYWIVGMSIIGTPILIGYLGYKGYCLGYTISAVLKILGMQEGNLFVFKHLFLNNIFLVFIMIFLANFSIKISKNFFEKEMNLKTNTLKYTVVTSFMLALWLGVNFVERIIFSTF